MAEITSWVGQGAVTGLVRAASRRRGYQGNNRREINYEIYSNSFKGYFRSGNDNPEIHPIPV